MRQGDAPAESVVMNLMALIGALSPPQVMYVRLLNPAEHRYSSVESYFRDCVDPLVADLGFARHEVGTDHAKSGFMNAEIFEQLDRSTVVFVDLTGMRSNCFGEMCYALGRDIKTIVSVIDEEIQQLPFDFKALPCFAWNASKSDAETIAELRDFWERHIDRPPLVRRRGLAR
jgi:hypothetical protein